ncbi:MAG: hypothetical protein QXO70_01635 [Candidatus Pacearchaeota archaeon]
MEEELTNHSFGVSGEDSADPSEGKENGENGVSLKDLVNEITGRSYASDEEAAKGLQHTYRYVGKVGKFAPYIEKLEKKYGGEKEVLKFMEEIVNKNENEESKENVDISNFVSKEQYEIDTFFAQNQQYQPHKDIILALKKESGKPLSEVVEMPSFKDLFEKAKGYENVEKSKSVLQSNPRLGEVVDKITEAKEKLNSGDYNSAKKSAVEAVIETFDL